jgi:hypothetical protein
MPYTSGDTPMVGDSIRDKGGRIGSVTAASHGGIFTVSWHGGVVGARSSGFILMSIASFPQAACRSITPTGLLPASDDSPDRKPD